MPKKKKILTNKSLLIKEKEIAKNTRPNLKLKELRMKKKEKSKDSENFKKRQLIDKLKSMLLELKEHLKRAKDKLGKEKDWNTRRDFA